MRREEGFTLIEMLVSVAISALVMGALAGFVVTGYQTFASVNTVMGETEELSLIRLVLTEDVRSAYPDALLSFRDTSGQQLTLGIYDQRFGFRTVQYQYASDGTLTRTVFPYSSSPNPPAQTGHVLARRLALNYPSALFSVTVASSQVTATIPLPGRTSAEPVRTWDITAAMRPQLP